MLLSSFLFPAAAGNRAFSVVYMCVCGETDLKCTAMHAYI